MNKNYDIIIFSVDIVFINILKRIIEKTGSQVQIEFYQSFSEAQAIPEELAIKLILVDDLITGTSSYELISFLRLRKKIRCPIYYFDTAEYQSERKSLLIGASQFINKPFNPEEVEQKIKNTLYNT